mmetsp:Transcript_59801/g.165349  ORF Transcript_59801/g.165349 Transcript_59801/m.165349 type:complete len:345 (+) Transcript_59801:432-1466(+)
MPRSMATAGAGGGGAPGAAQRPRTAATKMCPCVGESSWPPATQAVESASSNPRPRKTMRPRAAGALDTGALQTTCVNAESAKQAASAPAPAPPPCGGRNGLVAVSSSQATPPASKAVAMASKASATAPAAGAWPPAPASARSGATAAAEATRTYKAANAERQRATLDMRSTSSPPLPEPPNARPAASARVAAAPYIRSGRSKCTWPRRRVARRSCLVEKSGRRCCISSNAKSKKGGKAGPAPSPWPPEATASSMDTNRSAPWWPAGSFNKPSNAQCCRKAAHASPPTARSNGIMSSIASMSSTAKSNNRVPFGRRTSTAKASASGVAGGSAARTRASPEAQSAA